jgi:hypothetical protein
VQPADYLQKAHCNTSPLVRAVILAAGVIFGQVLLPAAHAQPTDFVDAAANTCPDFVFELFSPFHPFRFRLEDLPDAGWVLVNRSTSEDLLGPGAGFDVPKFRSASGLVLAARRFDDEIETAKVNHTDFPDIHDSHDFHFDLFLDPILPDFQDIPILSFIGKDFDEDESPDTLHLEWETGILTDELNSRPMQKFPSDVINRLFGQGRFFPRWAWPSVGDRVWANG